MAEKTDTLPAVRESQPPAEQRHIVSVNARGIQPHSVNELWQLAQATVRGGFAPKGLQTNEQVFAAMAMGMELGLPPMAALRGIAVINGKPSVYGDVAMALVRRSGQLESSKEWIEGSGDDTAAVCEVKRKGMPDAVRRSFSVADAKRAKLWGKGGPWSDYPKRMLQMRARGFALRDEFADVLQGMYIAEELQDGGEIPTISEPDKPRTAQVLDKVHALIEPDAKPQLPPAELPPQSAQESSWVDFVAECEQEAQRVGLDAEVFDKGVGLFLVARGLKGKEDQMKPEDRAALLDQIRNKSGVFAV